MTALISDCNTQMQRKTAEEQDNSMRTIRAILEDRFHAQSPVVVAVD